VRRYAELVIISRDGNIARCNKRKLVGRCAWKGFGGTMSLLTACRVDESQGKSEKSRIEVGAYVVTFHPDSKRRARNQNSTDVYFNWRLLVSYKSVSAKFASGIE
jgi:hypothetical protein